jgi:hypothetical protein
VRRRAGDTKWVVLIIFAKTLFEEHDVSYFPSEKLNEVEGNEVVRRGAGGTQYSVF